MDRYILKRKEPSQNLDMNWEEKIKYDLGKRIRIEDYYHNLKNLVRRKYLLNGPCQPRTYEFPQTLLGESNRRSFTTCRKNKRRKLLISRWSIHKNKEPQILKGITL
jgi:hypothetical protein